MSRTGVYVVRQGIAAFGVALALAVVAGGCGSGLDGPASAASAFGDDRAEIGARLDGAFARAGLVDRVVGIRMDEATGLITIGVDASASLEARSVVEAMDFDDLDAEPLVEVVAVTRSPAALEEIRAILHDYLHDTYPDRMFGTGLVDTHTPEPMVLVSMAVGGPDELEMMEHLRTTRVFDGLSADAQALVIEGRLIKIRTSGGGPSSLGVNLPSE